MQAFRRLLYKIKNFNEENRIEEDRKAILFFARGEKKLEHNRIQLDEQEAKLEEKLAQIKQERKKSLEESAELKKWVWKYCDDLSCDYGISMKKAARILRVQFSEEENTCDFINPENKEVAKNKEEKRDAKKEIGTQTPATMSSDPIIVDNLPEETELPVNKQILYVFDPEYQNVNNLPKESGGWLDFELNTKSTDLKPVTVPLIEDGKVVGESYHHYFFAWDPEEYEPEDQKYVVPIKERFHVVYISEKEYKRRSELYWERDNRRRWIKEESISDWTSIESIDSAGVDGRVQKFS